MGLTTHLIKPIKEMGHLSSSPGFSPGSSPLHSVVGSRLLSCTMQEQPKLLSRLLAEGKACDGVTAREETPPLCWKMVGGLMSCSQGDLGRDNAARAAELCFALLCWSVNCFWTERNPRHRLMVSVNKEEFVSKHRCKPQRDILLFLPWDSLLS